MATPTTDILTSTLQVRAKKMRDNLMRTTPFLDFLQRKSRIITVEGGARISLPVALAEHSIISNLGGGGYGVVSDVVTDTMRDAVFEWSNFEAPVILTKVEATANKGPEARVRILDGRMKTVFNHLRKEVETQIFAGSSSVLGDMTTMFGVDASTGVFEELAFGSQANSVGGLAKSSFVTTWQHQVANVADDFATNGLSTMRAAAIAAGTYGAGIDGVFLSTAAMGLYSGELQTQDRYVMEKPADGARLRLQFDGAEVHAQKDLGAVGGSGTNLSGVMLDSTGVALYVDKDGNFALQDPEPVSGYVAKRWPVFCRMQLVFDILNVHAAIVNAET